MRSSNLFKGVLFLNLITGSLAWSAIAPQHTFLPSKTSISTVVAVIDTGVDIEHQDLISEIWKNNGEIGLDAMGRDKSTNQVDDDGNGFVDDVHGWNFVSNKNDVSDSIGHGTHIAGIIKNQFKKNVQSGDQKLKMMILKYYSAESTDEENLQNSIRAIRYAIKMKAQIINYSGGGSTSSKEELDILKKANEKNILIVAAAGNSRHNNDYNQFFPASYNLANIISVGASDSFGRPATFSNYGANSVDIFAPGKMILSALPNGNYGYMSGTSQATAFVTGLCAAMAAEDRSLTPKRTLSSIVNEGANIKALIGKSRYAISIIN